MIEKNSSFALIMNPTSKSGRGKKQWRRIEEYLAEFQIPYVVYVSAYQGHSFHLAKNLALQGYKALVAVGGDGTINEVLNGIFASGRLLPLGILYTGTSPDICRYHKIPLDLKEAVRALANFKVKKIDVGRVEYTKTNVGATVGHFLCSVNLGVGAAIARGSNSGLRRYLGDEAGTLVSMILSLLQYRKTDFAFQVDGEDLTVTDLFNVTIGKNPLIASGIQTGIHILPDNRKLYLFAISKFSLLELLFHIPKLYKGTFTKHKNNLVKFVKSVEVLVPSCNFEVEFDGDPQGFLPCTISLAPEQLELIAYE